MNFLPSHINAFEFDFLNKKRNVYEAKEAPQAEIKPETAEAPAAQAPSQPMVPKDWSDHAKKVDTNLAALRKVNQEAADKSKEEFGEKLVDIKKEYDGKIKDAKTANDEEKKAASEHISPKIDELIKAIREKAGKGKEADYDKTVAEGEKGDKKPETEKSKESEKKGEKLTDQKQIDSATKLICQKIGVTDKEWMGNVRSKVEKEMNFTTEQIQAIKDGKEFDLNKDQQKQLKDSAPKVNEYSPKKGEALSKKINELLGKVENKQAREAIRNMFDTDAKPLRRYLVMNCNITEDKKEGLKIGGNVVKNITDIKQYLPPEAQKNFDAMLAMKKDDKGTGLEKLQTEMWNAGKEGVGRLETIKTLQNELLKQLDPEAAAEKSKSPFDALIMLVKLFQTFKKATSSGDWKSFNEFMEDWNESKNNPKELDRRIQVSRDAYTKTIDSDNFKPNVKDLLSSIKDTRGPEADKLFLANVPMAERAKSPLNRYRFEAKDMLADKVKNSLGVTKVEEITKSGDKMEFKTEKDGVPMTVEMNLGPEKQARIIRSVKKDNGDWEKPASTDIKFQPFTGNSIDDLKPLIDGGAKTPEATQPAPVQPSNAAEGAPAATPANPEVKKTPQEIINGLNAQQLKQIKDAISKNPRLKADYLKFVKNFPHKQWDATTKETCRRAYLESKVEKKDIMKIVESITKPAEKKTEEKKTEKTEPAKAETATKAK